MPDMFLGPILFSPVVQYQYEIQFGVQSFHALLSRNQSSCDMRMGGPAYPPK